MPRAPGDPARNQALYASLAVVACLVIATVWSVYRYHGLQHDRDKLAGPAAAKSAGPTTANGSSGAPGPTSGGGPPPSTTTPSVTTDPSSSSSGPRAVTITLLDDGDSIVADKADITVDAGALVTITLTTTVFCKVAFNGDNPGVSGAEVQDGHNVTITISAPLKSSLYCGNLKPFLSPDGTGVLKLSAGPTVASSSPSSARWNFDGIKIVADPGTVSVKSGANVAVSAEFHVTEMCELSATAGTLPPVTAGDPALGVGKTVTLQIASGSTNTLTCAHLERTKPFIVRAH